MKTCPHCEKELPGEMQFCPYCMHKLIAEQAVGGTPSKRRRSVWLWIVVGAAALAVLCALLVWGLGRLPDRQPPTSEPIDSSAASLVDDGGAESAGSDTTTDEGAPTTTTTTTTTAFTADDESEEDASTTPTTASKATSKPSTSTTTKSGAVATSSTSSTTKATITTEPDPCAHGHDWEEITESVQHEEVGHYEKVVTGYNTITKHKCAVCYAQFDSLDSYYTHFETHTATSDSLVAILRDRYTISEERQPIYENQWVVDEDAYTEERVVGHRCRVCGKTK